MTTAEIRAALSAYRNEGRMFSPHEWAGMVEYLLPIAEADAIRRAVNREIARETEEICRAIR